MDYSDIMDKKRPEHINDDFSARHPRMSVGNRAKIFSPFATLKSHAPHARRRERQTVCRIELSPEAAQILNERLVMLAERLRTGEDTTAAVTYFVPDSERKGEGSYTTVKGRVKKICPELGYIKTDDTVILIENIYGISI